MLDEMLTLEQAAQWLGMNPRVLAQKSRGRKPIIPAFRLGHRLVRFHRRTVIAKLAADAGVSPEVIQKGMGL